MTTTKPPAEMTDQELDHAVAEAMGWELGGWQMVRPPGAVDWFPFRPSKCANDALRAVETLDKDDYDVEIRRWYDGWRCTIEEMSKGLQNYRWVKDAPTLPRALCLAFLAAKGAG